jgi:hypothetical protein
VAAIVGMCRERFPGVVVAPRSIDAYANRHTSVATAPQTPIRLPENVDLATCLLSFLQRHYSVAPAGM